LLVKKLLFWQTKCTNAAVIVMIVPTAEQAVYSCHYRIRTEVVEHPRFYN